MKSLLFLSCLGTLTFLAVSGFADEDAPKRVEQVGDARWTSSLGLTSDAEARESAPPESGAVMLEAPAAGTPEATIDPAAPKSAQPYDHLDVFMGLTVLRPTNYGEEDDQLDAPGLMLGMTLGYRFPIGSFMGLTLDFDFRGVPAVNFDDLVTMSYIRGFGALGPYFTLVDSQVVNWIVGSTGYAGVAIGLPDAEPPGVAPLYGARLYTALTLGPLMLEPSYRWMHPGVDVHYLGAKLFYRTSATFGVFVGGEHRVKNAGGVDLEGDLGVDFARTAPEKSEFIGGVNLWF